MDRECRQWGSNMNGASWSARDLRRIERENTPAPPEMVARMEERLGCAFLRVPTLAELDDLRCALFVP